jgi:hypothetical protein
MGAFADDPAAFHRWLEGRWPGMHAADAFVPRALFGEYLLETVASEVARSGAQVSFVHGAVAHMERIAVGAGIMLASGRSLVCRTAILCPGLPPASAPWSGDVDHGAPRAALVADPWEAGALSVPDPDSEVLVLGSGLTAIDVVQGIRRLGHRGRITMLSRHGRLPLPHAAAGETVMQAPFERFAGGPRGALAALRAMARERSAAGLGWQGALDAVRPHVTALWRSWSLAERRRFLRCARGQWEIHRHRAPRAVLEDVHALMAAGTLRIERGTLRKVEPEEGGTVRAVAMIGGAPREFHPSRIYNCIGPGMHITSTIDPLLGSLLRSGTALADPLGLGLQVDAHGCLLGGPAGHGADDPRILLVGALRRGDSWESTAVPELRVQAEQAARRAAEFLAADRGPAGRNG